MKENVSDSNELMNYTRLIRFLSVDWWAVSETCDEALRLDMTTRAIKADLLREEIFDDRDACNGIAEVSGGMTMSCRRPSRSDGLWPHTQRFRRK